MSIHRRCDKKGRIEEKERLIFAQFGSIQSIFVSCSSQPRLVTMAAGLLLPRLAKEANRLLDSVSCRYDMIPPVAATTSSALARIRWFGDETSALGCKGLSGEK